MRVRVRVRARVGVHLTGSRKGLRVDVSQMLTWSR